MSKKQAIFSFLVSLALVFASAGVSFADSSTVFEIPQGYFGSADSSAFSSASFKLCTYTDNQNTGYAFASSTSGVYIFLYPYSNDSRYYVAICSSDSTASTSCLYYYSDWHLTYYNTSYNTPTYDESTGLYYYRMNITRDDKTFNSDVPYFSSLSEGLQAVRSATSSVVETFPVNLEKGYANVIYGPCTITSRSYQINGSWNFIQNGSYRVNGSVERLLQVANITDGFSPDKNRTRSQMIQWQALNENSSGVSSNYAFTDTEDIVVPSGAVFLVTYPEYYGVQGAIDQTYTYQNSVSFVGAWDVEYSGSRPVVKQVALETVQEWVNREYQIYNVFRPLVYEEAGTITTDDQGGLVVSYPIQPSGGGNAGQPALNEETNLFGLISKFVNDVKNLFNTASQAVSDLVTTGSSFMLNISAMFAWLPAPLLSVIIGGLTVLIVVGVLKVLWR